MFLIATDEAGYGPKLGPLVVAGSLWEIPDHILDGGQATDLLPAFSQLTVPLDVAGQQIVVNDSKAVFKPNSKRASGKRVPPYRKLELAAAAGCRWCDASERPAPQTENPAPPPERIDLVKQLAPLDQSVLRGMPWLAQFADETLRLDDAAELHEHWAAGQARLLAVTTRVLNATSFNERCTSGFNKADLLSETTLSLVRELLPSSPGDQSVSVFCDRHGGRRYYAGPLQSAFETGLVQVIHESNRESAYQVPLAFPMTIRFTVKGDSFTPVAFSSMVAKYLREKAMESLNQFFQQEHQGANPLIPTAGYPVDADRFLTDIAPIIKRLGIPHNDLVRSR